MHSSHIIHNQIWVSFLVGLLSTGNLPCAIHLLFGIPTGLLLSCVCSNRPQTSWHLGNVWKALNWKEEFHLQVQLLCEVEEPPPNVWIQDCHLLALPASPIPAHSIKSMQGDDEYMRFSNHRNLQLTRIQTKVVLHQVCTDTNDTQISDRWQLLVNRFAYQPGWKMRDKAKVQAMAELTPCAPVCFWISLASVIAT